MMESVNDVQVWLEKNGFSDYKAKFMGMFACFVLLNLWNAIYVSRNVLVN